MNIHEFLQSRPIAKTGEVTALFGVTPRTLLRWQDSNIYENPMPKPLFACKGSQNTYDCSKLLEWYHTLPLQKVAKSIC